MTTRSDPNGLLHGTLDALVLKTLARGPRHGYGIARWIEDETDEAVVVEEAWSWASVGASIVDLIQREAFDDLDAPVLKLNGVDAPMPYAKNLEHAMLPTPHAIAAAAKKVLYR